MELFMRVVVLLLSLTFGIFAKGTLMGTSVANQAQINFMVGGIENNITSNTDSFVVDQIVDIDITWQDNTPVEVGAGESGHVLTFRVTNLGNGDDNISLVYDHNSSSDFTPDNSTLYRDDNNNSIYDPGIDTPIGHIDLAADANATLFIVADIPADANISARSYDAITAISDTNATVGADNPSAVDVVVRTGRDRDQGIYEVRDYWLVQHKSATVHSDDNLTHTGSHITYTIELSIGGNSAGKSIANIVMRDIIPDGTKYVAGTLHLNGVSLTDPTDGDAGSCDGNTTIVDVGTLGGTADRNITFDVEVE